MRHVARAGDARAARPAELVDADRPDGLSSRPSCSANGADWLHLRLHEEPRDLLVHLLAVRRPPSTTRTPPSCRSTETTRSVRTVAKGRQPVGQVLAVGEHDELGRDAPEQGRQVRRDRGAEDADPLAAELVAVAERAVRDEVAPERGRVRAPAAGCHARRWRARRHTPSRWSRRPRAGGTPRPPARSPRRAPRARSGCRMPRAACARPRGSPPAGCRRSRRRCACG